VVVVAVRLLGLLWFADDDGGVGEASTTLRSILDQTVVGIPFSSSSLAMIPAPENWAEANDEVGPNCLVRALDPERVVGESVVGG